MGDGEIGKQLLQHASFFGGGEFDENTCYETHALESRHFQVHMRNIRLQRKLIEVSQPPMQVPLCVSRIGGRSAKRGEGDDSFVGAVVVFHLERRR